MKLLFEFDIDKKKIVFFGNGFEISSNAETYEDIAEFAKCVIENDIGIPNLMHMEKKQNIRDVPTVEKLSKLIGEAERNLWGKSVSGLKEKQKFIAEYLDSHNVVVQNEAKWETFTEIRDNTFCGDGVKIQHKRCSYCKQPMGLSGDDFCGKCGSKIK